MKKYLLHAALICGYLFIITSHLKAQAVSDSLIMQEVHVEATRIGEPLQDQPIQVSVIDSAMLQKFPAENVGNLLANNSFTFVQSYGPGGLFSVSNRGYDASHVQIVWDGFVINHPMVGSADLSLIPISLLNSVEISSGNASSSFGSGSSGGTIYLNSNNFANKASLIGTIGSFGLRNENLFVGTSSGNFKVSVMAGHKMADNNYRFYNFLTHKQDRKNHNNLSANHLLANVAWDKANLHIKSAIWYNGQTNDLPYAINLGDGYATQTDKSLRWFGSIGSQSHGLSYKIRTYYSFYNLGYVDKNYGTNSQSKANEYGLEGDLRKFVSEKLKLHGMVRIKRTLIQTNNYKREHNRYIFSSFINAEYHPLNKLRIYPSVRIDSYSDFGSALSPSLGANYQLISNVFYLRGQIKKDFTAPTFNELYWSTGGNPNLKAEKSYAYEVGFSVRGKAFHKLYLNFTPSLYHSVEHNGIRWVPGKNQVWSPINILDLRMQGADLGGSASYRTHNFIVTLKNYTTWTKARTVKNSNPSVDLSHKQMPYVPEWMVKDNLQMTWRQISFFVNQRWIGKRYTTADHSSSIDPLSAYNVWDAGLSVNHNFSSIHIRLDWNIFNLFNKQYQVVAYYPMPKRYTQITLSISKKI